MFFFYWQNWIQWWRLFFFRLDIYNFIKNTKFYLVGGSRHNLYTRISSSQKGLLPIELSALYIICSAIDIETTEHASAESLLVFMEIWTQFLMKFIQPNMERCLSVTLFHFFFLDYRRARSVCFTCTSYEMETTEHLLIHCSFSWRLWTKYMTWWGIIFWCLSKSLDSLLFKWYLMVFINFQKKVWQVLLFFVWHYLDIQINLHASWLWTKFITW